MREASLSEAVRQIRQACERNQDPYPPYVFIVGAGLSAPGVPPATEVERHCRDQALAADGDTPAAPVATPMGRYSHWFQRAYPDPEDRRAYLASLIQGKRVTASALRLAHLLLEPKIASLVITPNFDDFIARALALFGGDFTVIDHPFTAERIAVASRSVQIVHVHGSYRFYDCANLQEEIVNRAADQLELAASIPRQIEALLGLHSAIVIGYAGWEGDVIMGALRRRLRAGLKRTLFWFCYRRGDADLLPGWLKDHPNVHVVLPRAAATPAQGAKPLTVVGGADGQSTDRVQVSAVMIKPPTDPAAEPLLPSQAVLDGLINELKLEEPALTRDPLRFYADHLARSFPAAEGADRGDDIYGLESVMRRLRLANESPRYAFEDVLESVRGSIRRSAHGEAIAAARAADWTGAAPEQQRELMQSLMTAATSLNDDSDVESGAYELLVQIADGLPGGDAASEVAPLVARARVNQVVVAMRRDREDEVARAVEDGVRRFGDSADPAVALQVARLLLLAGTMRSGQVGREEGIDTLRELDRRYGSAAEPPIRDVVARALSVRGYAEMMAGRFGDAARTFATCLERFGDATGPGLLEPVAAALVGSALVAVQSNAPADALPFLDRLAERFGVSADPEVRERVTQGLEVRVLALVTLDRAQEALATADQLLGERRTVSPEDAGVRKANALGAKGFALARLGRADEALAAFAEQRQLVEGGTSPLARFQAALSNLGSAFAELASGRSDRAIAASDAAVAAVGNTEGQPMLDVVVASAMVLKGVILASQSALDAAIDQLRAVERRYAGTAHGLLRQESARALLLEGGFEARRGEVGGPAALAAFERVEREYSRPEDRPFRTFVAAALFEQCRAHGDHGREAESRQAVDRLLARFGDDADAGVQQQVVGALALRAEALGRAGRVDEALAVHGEIVRRFGQAEAPFIRLLVEDQQLNRSQLLNQAGRVDEALAVCAEIVRAVGEDLHPVRRAHLVRALRNRMGLLLSRSDFDGALAAVADARAAIRKPAVPTALEDLVLMARWAAAILREEKKRPADARRVCDEALAELGPSLPPSLDSTVAFLLWTKAASLDDLGDEAEARVVARDLVERFQSSADPEVARLVSSVKSVLESEASVASADADASEHDVAGPPPESGAPQPPPAA